MSIRCALGLHRWKPVMRQREKPVTLPVLFPRNLGPLMPMVMLPTGMTYVSRCKLVGHCCIRCGKRK